MKRILFLMSMIVAASNSYSQAQESVSAGSVQDSLSKQLAVFPQEKIYVHTDRDVFIPGEKIWLKAYLVNAFTGLQDSQSRYVYCEFINPQNAVTERIMLARDSAGVFAGYIFLSDFMPEGIYTLRAYTKYMENQGNDSFFSKQIKIRNLPDNDKKAKQNVKKPKDDYEVTFYPEGGNFLCGTMCVVAFKALNRNGSSAEITGEIVDEKGAHITDVRTDYAGMGSFNIYAEKGISYYLKCRSAAGTEKKFKLPQSVSSLSLALRQVDSKLFIAINRSADCPAQQTSLLVHQGGLLLYFAAVDETRDLITFSMDNLPLGIIQILLLDGMMNPLSERLVFNKRDDSPEILFETDKDDYSTRDRIVANIKISGADSLLMNGNLSVAVVDDQDDAVDTMNTIVTSLLLNSELRGHIENPAYYLRDGRKSGAALNLLMMTHGWRRYNIAEAIKGNYTYPEKQPYEAMKIFTGRVKTILLGRPVRNPDLAFYTSDINLAGELYSDEMGQFAMVTPDFADSTTFLVYATNAKGSSRVEIEVDTAVYPPVGKLPPAQVNNTVIGNSNDAFIEKSSERAKYDENMRVINLKEIVVTANVVPKRDKARLEFFANSSSDRTIYRDEFKNRSASSVTSLLTGVAGIMVSGNGEISIRGGGRPLILLDGMPQEWPEGELHSIYESPLEMVSVYDIESIDIFKGASAAIFGMRGANGAISITTRRDNDEENVRTAPNFKLFSPLGVQKPAEFYSPKYDTPEAKNLGNPDYRTTIYWKPDAVILSKDAAQIEFYTSDRPSTYSVIIEGITADGDAVRTVKKISVK